MGRSWHLVGLGNLLVSVPALAGFNGYNRFGPSPM